MVNKKFKEKIYSYGVDLNEEEFKEIMELLKEKIELLKEKIE